MNKEFIRDKGLRENISLKNLISEVEAPSEPYQRSKMKRFVKQVNSWKLLTIFETLYLIYLAGFSIRLWNAAMHILPKTF